MQVLMRRLKDEKGYLYKGYKVYNHGYYPPDRQVWWEAINMETGEADYRASTKGEIKQQIDGNHETDRLCML